MRTFEEIVQTMSDPRWIREHAAHEPPESPEETRARRLALTLRRSGIPPLYFEVEPAEAPPERGRLYIGKPGVGKTYSAVADALALGMMGASVRWLSLPAYMASIRSHEPTTPLSEFMWANVVVLDDIAQNKPPEWMRDSLYAIIDGLLSHKVFVIATSNESRYDISRTYGDAIASRLVGLCPDTVAMEGDDRRFKKESS